MTTRTDVKPTPITLPNLLTEREVSALTRIPVRTLQDWRYRPPKGRAPLPYTRVGVRVLYRDDTLRRWLDEQTVGLIDE